MNKRFEIAIDGVGRNGQLGCWRQAIESILLEKLYDVMILSGLDCGAYGGLK